MTFSQHRREEGRQVGTGLEGAPVPLWTWDDPPWQVCADSVRVLRPVWFAGLALVGLFFYTAVDF